jgi:hypothetical protein
VIRGALQCPELDEVTLGMPIELETFTRSHNLLSASPAALPISPSSNLLLSHHRQSRPSQPSGAGLQVWRFAWASPLQSFGNVLLKVLASAIFGGASRISAQNVPTLLSAEAAVSQGLAETVGLCLTLCADWSRARLLTR